MHVRGLKREKELHEALIEHFPELESELESALEEDAGLMTVQVELVTGYALDALSRADEEPFERLARAVSAVATSRGALHPELESAIWVGFVMRVAEELVAIPERLERLVPAWLWELGMSNADRVWNRAATESGGANPREGDRVLADLLLAHGYVMNGGVWHSLECLDQEAIERAKRAYEYFGLPEISRLLARAAEPTGSLSDTAIDQLEAELDASYAALVPTDESLARRFEDDYRGHPERYAPLEDE